MRKNFIKAVSLALALAMMPAVPVMAEEAPKEFTYAHQNGGAVEQINLSVGSQEDIRFIGVPDYRNFARQWKSSNEEVAKVDNMGMITAVAEGSAVITYELGDGTVYTSEGVTVNVTDEFDVTLGTAEQNDIEAWTLEEGETIDLNFYGVKNWNGGKGFKCKWLTSDKKVATVNYCGVVTAVADGKATILLEVIAPDGRIYTIQPTVVTVKGEAVATPTPAPTATPKPAETPTIPDGVEVAYKPYSTSVYDESTGETVYKYYKVAIDSRFNDEWLKANLKTRYESSGDATNKWSFSFVMCSIIHKDEIRESGRTYLDDDRFYIFSEEVGMQGLYLPISGTDYYVETDLYATMSRDGVSLADYGYSTGYEFNVDTENDATLLEVAHAYGMEEITEDEYNALQ